MFKLEKTVLSLNIQSFSHAHILVIMYLFGSDSPISLEKGEMIMGVKKGSFESAFLG